MIYDFFQQKRELKLKERIKPEKNYRKVKMIYDFSVSNHIDSEIKD